MLPLKFPKLVVVAVATLLLLLSGATTSAVKLHPSQYPETIRLRAGVLHAPPMALVETMSDGRISYTGFQIDLLDRLKIFAASDGVDLQFELEQSPARYDESFDLIANDCNTTGRNSVDECSKFDLIVGDYYSNADRYMRADLSPSWLRATITTLKYLDKPQGTRDFTTLQEAELAGATVCVPRGAYLSTVVRDKFPGNNYINCNSDESTDGCINLLKNGNCVLYADDENVLHYKTLHDHSLEVTRESFNTQFLVWPMREDLPRVVSKLMNKWMYRAVQNATLDELFFRYFKRDKCPHGTAGLNCELPCDPDHGNVDGRGKCICSSIKWTGDDCSIEVPEEKNMLPSPLVIACYCMAGINVILVIGCAVWLQKHHKRAHVRIAQPLFLMIILVGCLVSSSTIFALGQQDEGDGPVHACSLIPWLYSVGFSLSSGAMFAKIRRIYLLLKNAAEMKRVQISARETLCTVAVVLAIDIAILSVWTVVSPLEWKRTVTSMDVFEAPLESEGYCTSEHWKIFAGLLATFHLGLMVVACNMCYKARRIPENISNGKYVAIAMVSNLEIFLVVVPVLLMLGAENAQASFFVRSTAIWINDFAIVALIFGQLMYSVHFSKPSSRGLLDAGSHHCDNRSSHTLVQQEIHAYAKTLRSMEMSSTLRSSMASMDRSFNKRASLLGTIPETGNPGSRVSTSIDEANPSSSVEFGGDDPSQDEQGVPEEDGTPGVTVLRSSASCGSLSDDESDTYAQEPRKELEDGQQMKGKGGVEEQDHKADWELSRRPVHRKAISFRHLLTKDEEGHDIDQRSVETEPRRGNPQRSVTCCHVDNLDQPPEKWILEKGLDKRGVDEPIKEPDFGTGKDPARPVRRHIQGETLCSLLTAMGPDADDRMAQEANPQNVVHYEDCESGKHHEEHVNQHTNKRGIGFSPVAA